MRETKKRTAKIVDNFGIETIEISDRSIILEHDEKCELIYKYAKNILY